MPANKNNNSKPIDTLSKQEIDDRVTQTLQHLDEARKLWPGLRHMSEEDRKASAGKVLAVFAKPLGLLFGVLAQKKGQPRPAIAKAFDVLGAKDGGEDPEVFEAELLDVRLYRAQAEQKVVDALDDFGRHMADDVLDIGEKVMGPGLIALQMARTVAQASAEYASLLAPVLDGFRDLTKQARKARANKATAKGATAGADKPADK